VRSAGAPTIAVTTESAVAAGPSLGGSALAVATAHRLETPAAAPVHAVLAFSGDILMHSPLVNRARADGNGHGYDFSPMFAQVAPVLSAADLAVCHLESDVVPFGEELSTYPRYAIPPDIAVALRDAGFDRCSTASNHTIDRGVGTIDATVAALEAAGLTQAGMARTPEESVATLVDVNGITIAHLSYTFGFNGLSLPRDQPWRSNLIDVPTILAAAQDAKARGAEFVVVNLHWGAEGAPAITGLQREQANALTASPFIDLIVGEHAHVIQPIERINGKWVVFGMGNFISNMPVGEHRWPPSTQDGMIVSIAITRQPDGTVTVERPGVIPTWVDRDRGWIIRPVLAGLSDPSLHPAITSQLRDSLTRTASVVGEFIAG
jgi:poly-gamma-glutamate synthesis protein (capsule biosynthesis protein)